MKLVMLYDRIDRGTPKELRDKVAHEVRQLRKNPRLMLDYATTPMFVKDSDDGRIYYEYPLFLSLQKTLNAIIRYDYDRCGDKRYNHLIK